LESLANLALRRPRKADLPSLGRDALAGVISAVVQIAYCISFSALIFQGALASGFSLGLAAIIMGTVVTGIVVALTSTLSPADAGPDTPAVAVMSVLDNLNKGAAGGAVQWMNRLQSLPETAGLTAPAAGWT